ncbi:641ca948-160c-43c6-8a36-4fea55e5deb0 [Sclerotinia trifoliorum]|uniref:641ca948-160c-43c6-8a36-4fea55e5deb0 n=1 Tax=Sclerotinia trifoliorum TaxID=28548 RepID=A0A8H2ZLH9_9HELO|nr:641ca948-160c-43c6-8a36-4fea55e5deb0 [Sclerotinia trifoliorum]
MQSLAGKVVLVTGGSKGIGRAICFRLASQGAEIVINYSNDSSPANEVALLIGEENATTIKADAGNIEEISKLVDATIAKYAKIELDNVTVTECDQTLNLNVRGPLFLAQKSVPYIATGSSIILFSTTQCHASTVTPNYLTYIMSKGAIEQMTRGPSKDLARKVIMVNTVAPGPTSTELFLDGKNDQLLQTIAGFNLQNRIGQPDEVAEVVAFLNSSASSWVTGQILGVNGGMA